MESWTILEIATESTHQTMARKDAAAKQEDDDDETMTEHSCAQDRMTIEICKNSDYVQHVRELAEVIEKFYPHMEGHIECIHYEVAAWKVYLSYVCGAIPFLVCAFMIAGEYLLDVVGLPRDLPLLEQLRDSRNIVLVCLIFLGGISQYLVTAGAFEIYFNGKLDFPGFDFIFCLDELVFSKLQSKRWCTTEVHVLARIKLTRW